MAGNSDGVVGRQWCKTDRVSKADGRGRRLESPTIEGESPVPDTICSLLLIPKYGRARETWPESGRTIFQG
jgi:hypothetical protein